MENNTSNNCNFYNDIETNFKLAYKLCEQNYSHDDIINMLQNGNIPEKQIAALKLDCINNTDDAQILINNLTGCDGKIREAVAYKINLLLSENENTHTIFAKIAANTFADATIDINANICRLVVDSAILLKEYKDFSAQYTDKIVKQALEALNELDKFIFRDKKYVINKQLFKLYWCLEALSDFYTDADTKILEEILSKCANQQEYTIREKTAQIISKTNMFENLREKLTQDDNYYVRQALHHPCFL